MKKFLISFLLATLIMIPTEIFAADYETPHEFSAGDTISADMLNELFSKIENSSKTVNATDLIGTWSCICQNRYESSPVSGWSPDTDQLLITLNNASMIFTDDGDSTYSLSTSGPNPFWWDRSTAISSTSYTIKNNIFYYKDHGGYGRMYGINLVSPSRAIFVEHGDVGNQVDAVICDKQNLPPSMPATFTASVSGKTVSLAWTDNSTDETGFKVLRKDSLKGSYSTVTTTSADATSYSDTVTAAGSFWYRVSATNSNGDSVASKMVKVDVE